MESLTDLFGFKDSSVRLGQIKEEKTMREAIVAIPYITLANGDCSDDVSDSRASELKQFFTIDRERIKASTLVGSAKGDSSLTAGDSIRDLISNVEDYVLPPEFDFLSSEKVEPLVMYFFEFEYKLDKDDLSYIWQNIAPRDYKKMEQKIQYSSHTLADNELLSPQDIVDNPNLRWMVFKVKQRSMSKYENKTYRQVGTKKAPQDTGGYQVEYNWPYDYVSFVEMINIDTEVLMDNDIQKQTSKSEMANNELAGRVSSDKIKNAIEDQIIDKALNTLERPGDF